MAGRKPSESEEFEEIIDNCKICGKKIKFIRRKGRTSESLICQKCGKQ